MLLIAAGIWTYRSYLLLPDDDCPTIICLNEKDVLRSGVMENLSEEELMLIIDEDELERNLMDGGIPVPHQDSGAAGQEDHGI
jgi:hypothetical protein